MDTRNSPLPWIILKKMEMCVLDSVNSNPIALESLNLFQRTCYVLDLKKFQRNLSMMDSWFILIQLNEIP